MALPFIARVSAKPRPRGHKPAVDAGKERGWQYAAPTPRPEFSEGWTNISSLAAPRDMVGKTHLHNYGEAIGSVLLRGLRISVVAVCRWSQAKVFPQGPPFVSLPKQPSTLQFGNNHLDEILSTTTG